ncbi:GNAT family N-acetyltransferase [Phyllobacterium sp. 628]|uniref:GNAT family N-acetyltransferase n=1 Tax=Phyllobacterium sp. 628 TaxID=2718938 RepID=UPI0016622304|nr:GNAT family N-acetyltransferase [Phyllobacterium sp. 628]QND53596.1 GNAT family N-acetyltransferase [Phyllobacterium sp. 628]
MNFQWIDRIDGSHQQDLYALYLEEWWTKDRRFDDVARMLEHTDIVIGCCLDGKLVGFARVLTDYVYKAMIFDVIIDQKLRGSGLGRDIMDRITGHERLQSVASFELYCPDRLIPFYEKLGFAKSTSSLLRYQR